KMGIILNDKTAETIWDENAVSLGRKSKSKWLAYFMAMRARVFDDWVRHMLSENSDAMAFEEAARKQRFQEAEKEAKKRRREIAQAEKRIAELDRIFKRIYEDDISGAIRHERFLKLSADYEAEQKELTEQVKTWREAVETFEQDQADFASFAAIVRKYVS